MSKELKLPKNATFQEAPRVQHKETIVFVPFFAGRRKNLKRHADFMNDLGYNCVLFENSLPKKFGVNKIPISKRKLWGVKYIWADQVEELLNAVSGPKIVYAFSGPSACALEAISKRNLPDVKGLICDSGPFYYSMHCISNRLFYDEGITNAFKRLAVATIHHALWSSNHEKTLFESIEALPKGFPILSIRAEDDLLVPPWAIDAAFRKHENIDLKVLTVKEAGHLRGLKDHPEEYKPAVEKFLNGVTK